MADLFPWSVTFLLWNEGGFVNDPADSGGATNFGITRNVLSQWRNTAVSVDDVGNLTRDEASAIYRSLYWDTMRLPEVTQGPIATALLDCGVLFGRGIASLYAQKAILDCGIPLTLDAYIGPNTIAALNKIAPKPFLLSFVDHLQSRIDDITTASPKDLKFKAGWSERIGRYLTLA